MSALDQELVPVELGFCPCKGKPHDDGDVVYLYPDLPAPAGIRARAFFTSGMTGELANDEVEERIAELWLSMCVAAWTFVFDDGKPIPVTSANALRALPYGKGGRLVADKADDLYVDSVTRPLRERLEELSELGQAKTTLPAIPPKKRSPSRRRKPSSTVTTAKAHPLG